MNDVFRYLLLIILTLLLAFLIMFLSAVENYLKSKDREEKIKILEKVIDSHIDIQELETLAYDKSIDKMKEYKAKREELNNIKTDDLELLYLIKRRVILYDKVINRKEKDLKF